MPKNKGSHLEKNPFKLAMESSISNAIEISDYVTTTISSKSGSDRRIKALKNYYIPKNDALQTEAALLVANKVGKKAATKQVVVKIQSMKLELRSWIKQIDAVYPRDTEEFNRLFIGGATSFYKSSTTKRIIRIKALIKAIGTDASLAAVKVQIMDYVSALDSSKSKQNNEKNSVKTDKQDIKKLVNICTEGLWYVYCGLMMVYIKNPKKAIAFFPMRLINRVSNEKRYTLLVPAHIIKRICVHTFKAGEMVCITNNGKVELKIGLALKAKSLVAQWFTLAVGETVNINPQLLGDLTLRFVMVKNESLEARGDVTFIIRPGE